MTLITLDERHANPKKSNRKKIRDMFQRAGNLNQIAKAVGGITLITLAIDWTNNRTFIAILFTWPTSHRQH